MQITIAQAEIEQAIRGHISALGISAPVDCISFTGGRGNAGITASIELGPVKASVTAISDAAPADSAAHDDSDDVASDAPEAPDDDAAPGNAESTSLFGS